MREIHMEEELDMLKMVASNCRFDGASLYPTYREPFDVIFQRAKSKEWRALGDDIRTFVMRAEGFGIPESAVMASS